MIFFGQGRYTHTLGASIRKYKFDPGMTSTNLEARAGKHKLGARNGSRGWGPGAGPRAKQRAGGWKIQIPKQGPQLTLLYRGRSVRSSHQRCCIRKLFSEFCNIHREHLCWSLFLKNLQTFGPATLLKRPQHRCFPVNIENI